MRDWVSDYGPLITLASTIILLAVTGWYAHLTKRVAEANEASAKHAKVAAESSLAAVAASEAAVDVSLDVHPNLRGTVGGIRKLLEATSAEGLSADTEVTTDLLAPYMGFGGVALTCTGSTIYVHGCQLTSIGRLAEGSTVIVSSETSSVSLKPSTATPVRLHKGESVNFDSDGEEPIERLAYLAAAITHSYAESGRQFERKLEWRKRSDPERSTERPSAATA
jgi:hypothetical protein